MENQFDFAELEARTKQFMEQLATAPIVELIGVVGASAPSGAQSRGEELWTMLLSLEAWRIGSGEIQTRRMTVRRPVSKEELHDWQKSIRPYSVLRALARVVDDPQFLRPNAKLEEILAVNVTDQQLTEYALKLQEPVVYEDPVFGALILDRQRDRYIGNAVWNGKSVQIDLTESDSGNIEGSLSTLHQLWQDQRVWAARISEYAAQQLLPLKNENWLGEDEVPLTAEEFKAKVKLDTISIDQDSFTFWHNDGDMFWGHTIEICGTLNAGPTSADIPG